ncbi:UNVERIFIED_CONTAM: hypothetical protein GTU68_055246, partial [Idotea baltica]|nr:hypothetical protein [Idotea baltica]
GQVAAEIRAYRKPEPYKGKGVRYVGERIDDSKSHTLTSASTYETAVCADGTGTGSAAAAKSVGQLIGERATAAGVDTVVFDRGGNRYHGRVAALADAAREAGLKF